jgi:mannose-6-phosphate isomerase-like protein (cupin superfamily)
VIVDSRTVPEFRIPGSRSIRVVLDPRLGSYDKATVTVVTIEPGGTTGLHQHTSDEVIYVVSGRGRVTLVDGDVRVERDVEEGFVVVARAGVRHETRNTGGEPLRLYCIFIPPLPVEGYFAEALKLARGSG